MIVIGDAAHAPTPASGQGASLSMEDGVMLAQCLRDLPDPERAFARFEALRGPAWKASPGKRPGSTAARCLAQSPAPFSRSS
jgi:2-polyprenyl-6-methoxyphenol hydroxylase-like FAD-dependent oxidoreductase